MSHLLQLISYYEQNLLLHLLLARWLCWPLPGLNHEVTSIFFFFLFFLTSFRFDLICLQMCKQVGTETLTTSMQLISSVYNCLNKLFCSIFLVLPYPYLSPCFQLMRNNFGYSIQKQISCFLFFLTVVFDHIPTSNSVTGIYLLSQQWGQ